MISLSDEDLMVLYQNGSQDAFQILYNRHSGKIFGYIKSKVKTDEKARDIFQDVFMKIHRAKKLYNKSFPVLPWLFTVTRTVMIDHFRKEKNIELDNTEPIEVENTLTIPIHELPETQRAAVHMRYFEEKTFEDIAEKLKTSPDNVRQLVSRGIKKLRLIIKSGAGNE